MISITKIFEFSAGHFLPHHGGLCHNSHGHSYKLEIEISGPLKTKGEVQGMIMDFSELKRIVQEKVLYIVDHSFLNNTWTNPTAENMVETIVEWLQRELKYKAKLIRVRLWETSNSYAEWTR